MWLGAMVFLPPCCFTGDGAWPRAGKEAIRVDEEVVGSSEVKALERRIRELERVLSKKTPENEILREAVKVAHEKN